MENFIYLCPIIGSIIILLLFKKKFVLWEYIVIISSTMLITLITILCFKHSKCSDVEYQGFYVKSVNYYESWNEWVHRRCTRTIHTGKTTRTETYDCSYCRNHPEKWVMIDNNKNEYLISKSDYDRMAKIWKTEKVFVNMNRNYYTKDGDMYFYRWNNKSNSLIPITIAKHYSNKVLGSRSVFSFESISDEEAAEYNLFKYPDIIRQKMPFPQGTKISKHTYQDALMGISCDSISKKLNYINAYYGASKFIRAYILIYRNANRDIAFKQQSYWAGGNFNECVICIGVDNENNIEWCETFSWEDVPYLSVKSKQFLNSKNNLRELNEFLNYYETLLNEKDVWKCKDAEDFKYLSIHLDNNEIVIVLIISVVIMILISIWGYFNEFEN